MKDNLNLYILRPDDVILILLLKYKEIILENLLGDTCGLCRHLGKRCEFQTARNEFDLLIAQGYLENNSEVITLTEIGKEKGKEAERKYLSEPQTTLDEFIKQRRWLF